VDLFFQSIVKYWPGDVIGVVLTGMGRDGARGLKMLREAGQITVAQDQATSTVYGMPKAAAELRAAREILPLENIGPRLAMLVQTRRRRPRPTPPTSARVGATGLTRKNPQFHN
jgi:chemotaxis response regulator CheB